MYKMPSPARLYDASIAAAANSPPDEASGSSQNDLWRVVGAGESQSVLAWRMNTLLLLSEAVSACSLMSLTETLGWLGWWLSGDRDIRSLSLLLGYDFVLCVALL